MSSEILVFPDIKWPFILTTDASNKAIGAVLSLGEIGKDRPRTFSSRSLNKTEENYSTNEKEMLAIIWALDKLRTYLYGAKEIKILTDHQPLTFALSSRNNNVKLKRWKARIENFNYKLVYKPRKNNKVADALSRLPVKINVLTFSSDISPHSAEEDSSELILHCEGLLNAFKNQIIFSVDKDSDIHEEPHPKLYKHFFKRNHYDGKNLTHILKQTLTPNIINGVKIPENYLPLLQNIYKNYFSKFKIRITQRVVKDISNDEDKFNIIRNEHKRAHRNGGENKEQILERYYFSHMVRLIKDYTQSCKVCHCNKYDRHHPKPEFQATPLPSYPTEILHVDII